MYFLYTLNLISSIYFSAFYIFYYKKFFHLDLFNPLSINECMNFGLNIFRIYFGPAVVLQFGLYNKYFQFALFFTNVYMFCRILQTIFVFNYLKRRKKRLLLERFVMPQFNDKKRIQFVGFCFIVLAIFVFIILATRSFSVIGWIKSPRTGYQNHRDGAGLYYALYLLFLSIGFTFVLISCKHFFITFIFLFLLVWLLGSKGQMLFFFSSAYYFLWFKKSRYCKYLLFIGLPAVIFLMLLNFRSTAAAMTLAEYFDYFVNTAKYAEYYLNGKIDLFYGKLTFTNLYGILPRSLFPNKPYVYGILHLNEIFWPGLAATGNTPAFGGPVMQFADFGFIGVIFSGLFSISSIIRDIFIFYIFSNENYLDTNFSAVSLLIFEGVIGPAFLTFFGFPINIIMIIFLMFSINILLRIKHEPYYFIEIK